MADGDDSFLTRWSRRKAEARGGPVTGPVPADPATAPRPATGPTPEPAPANPLPGPRPVALTSAGADATDVVATGPGAPASPAAAAPASDSGSPRVAPPPPPPSLADVASLTRDSDYSRYVAADVAPEVRNAALRKLFDDPHFNVMDGLDTYIDDYGKPDPLPPGMLRKMVQSQVLGLFAEAPAATAASRVVARAAGCAEAPSDVATDASPAMSPDTPPDAQADDHSDTAHDAPAPAGTVASPAAPGPLATPAAEKASLDEDADLQLQPDDAARRPGTVPDPRPDSGREH